MNEQKNEGCGSKLANNLLVVMIGLIASGIGLFGYLTNTHSVQGLVEIWSNPGFIENSYAEINGTVWQVAFYNNKELKDPKIFEGKVRGARNGLRVDWDIDSPGKKVNDDFFSGIFNTTVSFNAGSFCFVVEVDDGARLFIDGEEIRNVWWGYTPGAVYKTPYQLSQGSHNIQLYYYDEYEKASFHIFWYENPGSECTTIGHPGIP